MKKRAWLFGLALIAALAAGGALMTIAAANAEVVEHWNVYAATGPKHAFTLFLGPFPDAHSCNVEAHEIVGGGGRAYCASQTVLSFDRKRETALIWEFLSAENPWTRLCGNHFAATEDEGAAP